MELLLGGYPIHSGAVPVHVDLPLLCSWRYLPLRAMMDKGDEGEDLAAHRDFLSVRRG